MAKRSMRVLKALAEDDRENVKGKDKGKAKKKKTSDKLIPGTVLTWRQVVAMMESNSLDLDSPMLIKLPIPLKFGTWPNGEDKTANFLGFCIDDNDFLCTDLFDIRREEGLIALDVKNTGVRKLVN